jgi:hypothetical protein
MEKWGWQSGSNGRPTVYNGARSPLVPIKPLLHSLNPSTIKTHKTDQRMEKQPWAQENARLA